MACLYRASNAVVRRLLLSIYLSIKRNHWEEGNCDMVGKLGVDDDDDDDDGGSG